MKRSIRWFVTTVLLLNAATAAALLTGNLPSVQAQTPTPSEPEETVEKATVSHEALRLLGLALTRRSEELDRRAVELDELMRGEEVLRLTGLLDSDETEKEEPAEEPTTAAAADADPDKTAGLLAFERLSRAYEQMEAESAATALRELAVLDRDAVIQLLSGWKPRTSGSILDALTQTDAVLAAELSYEIWKRSGKKQADEASSGH